MAEHANARKRDDTKAGWRIREWCGGAGFTWQTYYALPEELRPASVRIKTLRSRGAPLILITESPRDWLARVGRSGQR